MRVHFPFFDYAWLKLWVLIMVAMQAAQVVGVCEGLSLAAKSPTFGERVLADHQRRCAAKPWRCLK